MDESRSELKLHEINISKSIEILPTDPFPDSISLIYSFLCAPKLMTAGLFLLQTEKLNKSAVKFNYRLTDRHEKNSNIDGCNIVLISGYIREDVINCVDFLCNTVDN